MQLVRLETAADWLGGTFSGMMLDQSILVDPYNHPSVVPLTGGTATQATGAAVLAGGTAGGGAPAWQTVAPYAYTAHSGDTLTYTLAAGTLSATLHLTGIVAPDDGAVVDTAGLVADLLAPGALARVYLDGALYASVDLYGRAQDVAFTITDGASHTVMVSNSGTTSAPAGYSGTPTVGILGLTTNTAVTTGVTGASAGYNGTSLASVAGMMTYLLGSAGSQVRYPAATYTSAVIDLGVGMDDLQPYALTWEGTALASVTIAVASSPTLTTNLRAWAATPVAPVTLPLRGVPLGAAGLYAAALPLYGDSTAPSTADVPRGRYVAFSFTFPSTSAVTPYVRRLRLYAWDPSTDELVGSLGSLGDGAALDPTLGALLGEIACIATDAEALTRDYVAGMTIGGATDADLAAYGQASGYLQFTAESPDAYRARLLYAFQARGLTGGALPSLCVYVAQVAQGQTGTPSVTTTSGLTTATCLGVTVQQVSSSSPAGQYRVTVPAPVSLAAYGLPGVTGYPGLPGLPVPQAQAVITQAILDANPLGSVINPHNSGTYNIQFTGYPYSGN